MTIPPSTPNPDFFALTLDALARIVPGLDHRNEADHVAVLQMARCLFEELRPADAVEAATAARAIAAHFAAMDNFARAFKPDMSDEKVIRLRGNALAAGRVFNTQVQALSSRRQDRSDTQPAASLPAPVRPASIPEPASNVRHRAEMKQSIPDAAAPLAKISRRSAWHGGTALVPPTVTST